MLVFPAMLIMPCAPVRRVRVTLPTSAPAPKVAFRKVGIAPTPIGRACMTAVPMMRLALVSAGLRAVGEKKMVAKSENKRPFVRSN